VSQIEIVTLTPEQELLLLSHQAKWQQFVLSTARINPQDAIAAMQVAYRLIGEKKPEFVICDSPDAALKIADTAQLHLGRRIEKRLRKPLREQLESQISKALREKIYSQLRPDRIVLEGQIEYWINEQLKFRKFIPSSHWLDIAILLDIGTSILGYTYDKQRGETIQAILETCGWLLPYSGTCIICDRPVKICFRSFDDGEYIHAEGEPAIQFADGFSVYARHEYSD